MHTQSLPIPYQTVHPGKDLLPYESAPGQSLRRCASLDSRWHQQEYFGKRGLEFLYDTVCFASLSERFRCLSDSHGTSVEQRPCKEIDRNMRIFGSGNCPDTFEHMCRIHALGKNPPVERKSFALCTSVTPFRVNNRNEYREFTGELKSKTVFSSSNTLDPFRLLRIQETLTGQQ